MVYAITSFSKNGNKASESKAKEKNTVSLRVAEKLLKHALTYVTPETPIQAYKAFLACHIALNLKLRQITPKDDNVLLNTCYYAYHGKADNETAKGYKESDIKTLIDSFIPSFASALALVTQEKATKQDESDNEQDEQEEDEQNDDEQEEESFYPADFSQKQTDYLDAIIGGNRRKGLAIGMSLSSQERKECADFLKELEKELG